ncbi:MAG TPA: hypothetical protein VND87_12560 [Stellaceae bacterium]|nr:hypothetical protein [Stellaceae bacterium]
MVMLQQVPPSEAMNLSLSDLALDWAELRTVSGRIDGLTARQALAIGDRYQELQLEIYAVRREREAIMNRIFGFVPALVGNARADQATTPAARSSAISLSA